MDPYPKICVALYIILYIIMNPVGETMNKIQERAGVKLDVNAPAKPEEPVRSQFRPVIGGRNTKTKVTATVIITEGTSEGRSRAKQAILELASRGFATLLQAESFGEATVSVHPKYLHELIGTKGKIIRALEDTLGVKLTIPKTEWNPKTIQVRMYTVIVFVPSFHLCGFGGWVVFL